MNEDEAKIAWEFYCKLGLKPLFLPDNPSERYANIWKGWVHWINCDEKTEYWDWKEFNKRAGKTGKRFANMLEKINKEKTND